MHRPLRPMQRSNGKPRRCLGRLAAVVVCLALTASAASPRVAAESPASERAAEKPSGAEAERTFAVHIASYRTMKGLQKDWPRLVRAHPEFLFGLRVRVTSVDLGPQKGEFYRLKVGPLPSRKFAKELCRSLRQRGLYCAVMRFTGRRLG